VNAKDYDYSALARCIVRLDRPKILCRLRSRHAARTRKTSNKRSPLVQLREALHDPTVRAKGSLTHAELCELQGSAQALESMFIYLESEEDIRPTSSTSHDMLLEIIQATESFASKSMQLLVAALGSSQRIDPSTRNYLPIALEKLARYSSASRYLVAIARKKKYSIFSNIKVESFQISVPSQPLFQKPLLTLEQAWENLLSAKIYDRTRVMNLNVPSFLANPYHDKAMRFRDRISAAHEVWKVHAEIQLLVYHELNPEQPKPRVIASSKDACYLCNLFIGLHGQFQVARTHGRIYDRWLLPDWVKLSGESQDRMTLAREQLNSSIENTIIATMRSQRMSLNHPNESTLFTVNPCSSSTVNTIQLPTPVATPAASEVVQRPINLSAGIAWVAANDTSPSPPNHSVLEIQPVSTGGKPDIVTDRSVDGPHPTSSTPILEGKLISSPPCAASRTTVRTASSSPAEKKQLSNLSSAGSEDTSSSVTTVRKSITDLINSPSSGSSNGPGHETLDSHTSSDLEITSENSSLPRHTLTNPGESCSHLLSSATDEAYIEVGKLHLTLTRENPPLQDPQDSADCTVNVKWLNNQDHNTFHGSIQCKEVINVRDIAKGESLTFERGAWLSENDLLISYGPDILVLIRYNR
jgi:OTT_1508-like deaminase